MFFFFLIQHEFCTYMHLEYKEKEETVRRSTMATFTLPAKIMHLSRGEPVLEIQAAHDGTIVTVREDGVVNYWSPKLQLKNNKNVFVGDLVFRHTFSLLYK